MCMRLTLPHAEHLFKAVTSFRPLPAMNRWRFLRYDVFFFGTALSMPSHISVREGNEGSESDGIASPANGVGSNVRNGCERRWRSGRFRTGRTGPLRAGSSVCHSGGIGRARAMSGIGAREATFTCVRRAGGGVEIKRSELTSRLRLPSPPLARPLRGCPFPASCNSTRKSRRP